MKKLELILLMAQNGLLTAAAMLEKDGSTKSKKLAKVLRAAHAGISDYLGDD